MSSLRQVVDERGRVGEGLLTASYARSERALSCEQVSLVDLAEAVGTPAYVYSTAAVREQYSRLAQVLAPVPHRIHYSCKANGNLAILGLLRELGAGIDVVSGGELFRAQRAGVSGH